MYEHCEIALINWKGIATERMNGVDIKIALSVISPNIPCFILKIKIK